jgi:hypothetical protein
LLGALGVLHHRLIQGQFCRIAASKPLISLCKNASENRSVGGSTPPLGTIPFNDLALADRSDANAFSN